VSRQVFVTGGTGFIGRALVRELLDDGDYVITFSRHTESPITHPNLEHYYGDIMDKTSMAAYLVNTDVIYHLAGVLGTHTSFEYMRKITDVNIIGTLNVLEIAKEIGVPKVVSPGKPNVWLNPYSVTKQAAEDYGKIYDKYFGLNVYLPKWFNVYGPAQTLETQKAVPVFIYNSLQGDPIPIFGDGTQTGDFIYVTDAARGIIELEKHGESHGQVIDIGTGVPTSVNDLANLIIELTGSKSKLQYLPMRLGEAEHTLLHADTTYMESEVGFKCKKELREGLETTIEWYKEF
jgi:UDP-glucose 4-epimerase